MKKFPDLHIHDCGFVLKNAFPFLGATPDRKLCHNGQLGLIKIKCPFSARDNTRRIDVLLEESVSPRGASRH